MPRKAEIFAVDSSLQLGLDAAIEQVIHLFAILDVERAIPPCSSEQLECRSFRLAALVRDELGVVAGNAVANSDGARQRLAVVFHQVVDASAVVTLMKICGSILAELEIHLRIEVADKKV